MLRRLTFLAVLALSAPAAALDLSFEVFPGAPLTLSSTLEISQDGHPDLSIDPDWNSDPLRPPWYYALRLSTPVADGAWAVELLHHKMMLTNRPPEVQHFHLTHGYNVFTVQRHWARRGWRLVAGAGWVAAHPENTVRGLELDENVGLGGWGYRLAGPALTGGVGRRHRLGERVFVAGELRAVASWTAVPVVDGEARLRDLTAHLLLGAGVDF